MFTAEAITYLETVRIPLRLSCLTASGWPMVLSLWYVWDGERLCCATQQSARVVQHLQHDPRCAFEIAADTPPYCGVRGQGRAALDAARGADVLRRLLLRYVGDLEAPLSRRLLAQSATEVALIIEPLRVFTWDYSARMQGVAAPDFPKVCP